jgi:hypothetical protein
MKLLMQLVLLALLSFVAFGQNVSTTAAHTVSEGKEHTNASGVKVVNDASSSGTASIDPKTGVIDSTTTVITKGGFVGSITGGKTSTKITIGSSNKATIKGAGGTISIGGGSTVTYTNTSTVSGENAVITLSSGTILTIPPGSTVIVAT